MFQFWMFTFFNISLQKVRTQARTWAARSTGHHANHWAMAISYGNTLKLEVLKKTAIFKIGTSRRLRDSRVNCSVLVHIRSRIILNEVHVIAITMPGKCEHINVFESPIHFVFSMSSQLKLNYPMLRIEPNIQILFTVQQEVMNKCTYATFIRGAHFW